MSTNEKELERVLSNPDSLIMSDELEELIDFDEPENDEVKIEIGDKGYSVDILSMTREENGVHISLKSRDFSFNKFMETTVATFNLNEEIYSCTLSSLVKEPDNTVLTVFVPGI
jgi:hypothetical protein